MILRDPWWLRWERDTGVPVPAPLRVNTHFARVRTGTKALSAARSKMIQKAKGK